ncbi:MAG: DUF357 domain-containing protein [archaeon]
MREITEQKIQKYLSVTEEAIGKVKIGPEISFDWKEKAHDFLDMAQRYLSDARYFFEKGDHVNAFAAVNYSHGWLDAGARLGLFDVGGDSKLFTVDGS